MDISKWKKLKRTGHFRRKVNWKIHQMMQSQNYKVPSSVTNNEKNLVSSVIPHQKLCENGEVLAEDEGVAPVMESENESEVRRNWLTEMDEEVGISNNATEQSLEATLSDIDKNLQVRSRIRGWATSYKINHMALKELIAIWNERIPNLLPHDPRTLLKTPTDININSMGENGTYWHQGLIFCLQKYLQHESELPNTISLNINIDGLPIYNSSKQEFWPILCAIHELPHISPMIAGIFSGYGKPSDVESFLQPFVNELKCILENGLILNKNNKERKICVKIRCFICDSPARAFIKGVTNFNGKHGCLKCTTVGEYSYISHCVYFPRADCPKRTDEEFRSKQCNMHHKTTTPLLQLPIDMIEDFPVGDCLHLIDLGIMKKCLMGWRDGSIGSYRTKWSARDICKVSSFLKSCRMPSEIHRALRELDTLAHWKGLEYRTFLLYVGIVILREVLPQDIYEHFLLLFCSITICSTKKYFHLLDVAKTMLDHYVEMYRDFYGEDYITSNVHNLTHLVDDVKKFGELLSFSTYPFESKLFYIKKLLRHGHRPLAQVAKRLGELTNAETDFSVMHQKSKNYPLLLKQIGDIYTKLETEHFILTRESKDKWFLTYDNEIVAMEHVVKQNNITYIYGTGLKTIKNFFESPIKSSFLNIYVSNESLKLSSKFYTLSDIKCKMVAVGRDTETIFIPLVHTLM